MKRSSKIILTTAILATTAAGVVAVAGSDRGFYRHYGQGFATHISERVSSELELNESQQSNLQSLIDTVMEKRGNFKENRSERKAELLAMLDSETLDQGKINALLTQKTQAVESAAPEMISAIAQFTDSLSAEQRAELKEKLGSRMNFKPWR